ncbi:MAG: DUF4331 domain-containing protein [Chloroflexi bacterium]|nr:DUF4331 domain-containing protein [Chloroflexota bacterium]
MRTRAIIAIAAVMIVSGLSVLVVGGSSHSDAPLIAEDPFANNTDVYAFRSTEPGRENFVTIISNFIPMEEPGNGPTYFNFSDNVLYEIMVDTDGDAEEDLTYQFKFNTVQGAITKNTFLYNVAPIIGSSEMVTDPTVQYPNLNLHQRYSVVEVQGDRRTGSKTTLLSNARVAPANIGPFSTPSYDALADLAIHSLPLLPGIPEGRVFAGPRDEGFYVDLMAAFDLLGGFVSPSREPVDTFSGFNVHSIALEIPTLRFQAAGDTDGVIGVWSSASRQRVRVLPPGGRAPLNLGTQTQVSRLGNPLVNELLMPLSAKDSFNADEPKNDDANGFDDFITDPDTSQPGGAALIPLINSLTGCTPVDGRTDLDLVFLQGIPSGALGLPGNQNTESGAPARADMIRLNYTVDPTDPSLRSPLGPFGGDPAGWPNGRRVGDDVVDIALKGAAGGVLHLLGAIDCPVSLSLSDGVQENDTDYLDSFPYLGTPHQAYDHEHTHGGVPFAALGIGSGLLAGGIALGAVFAVRRRRNSIVGE